MTDERLKREDTPRHHQVHVDGQWYDIYITERQMLNITRPQAKEEYDLNSAMINSENSLVTENDPQPSSSEVELAEIIEQYHKLVLEEGKFSFRGFAEFILSAGYRKVSAPAIEPEKEPRAVELLQLILPMAKGYAYEHRVGSNNEYIDLADKFLAAWKASKGEK